MEMNSLLLNDFLGMPLLNGEAFTFLLFRFILNLIVIAIMVRFIYYRFAPKKEFAFTFFLFNIIIFFVCYFMTGMEIGMGFAFGLFAIFGILRYRTTTVPIKEMTYLLSAIVLAVLNSITVSNISYAEIFFGNGAILLCTFLMEHFWYQNEAHSKLILYENIELIKPEREEEMLEDLRNRTGLYITRFEIEEIDFLRDSASIKIYFRNKLPKS